MDDKEFIKFYNRNLLKGMIINFNLEEFCQNFEKTEKFEILLNIITDLIVEEKEFFMLKDSFVFKILAVLSEHNNSASSSDKDFIDSLFEYFRRILSLDSDDKNILLSNYKAKYEYIRGCQLKDEEHILCISNDAYLLKLLLFDDVNKIDVDRSILFSIEYILYSYPNIFNNEDIYTKTIVLIDKCLNKENIGSDYEYNAKEIKSDIQKIYKKEE